MKVTVHAGTAVGQSDDSSVLDVEDDDDDDACTQAAIDWSAGRWPESDSGYVGVVWTTRADGTIFGSHELDISADGEIAEP